MVTTLPPRHTRIKFCGFTDRNDIDTAIALGIDAIGLVFYAKSKRALSLEQAHNLTQHLPPFVTVVGLFVNPEPRLVEAARQQCRLSLLQFHGEESPGFCAALAQQTACPYIKALAVSADTKLEASEALHRQASGWFAGLLVDTPSLGYGGSGKSFDWNSIPAQLAPRLTLAGGLQVETVAQAIKQVRPFAVDVSSGIEHSPGIKSAEKMKAFVEAVRGA